MGVRSQIEMVFRDVAGEQDRQIVQPLRDDLGIMGVGLDSICLAHVVTRLEDILGVDPLSKLSEHAGFPQTFGQFVTMYEDAVSAKGAAPTEC